MVGIKNAFKKDIKIFDFDTLNCPEYLDGCNKSPTLVVKTEKIVLKRKNIVLEGTMKEKVEKAGKDSFGNVILANLKVGEFLADEIKERTGLPVRAVTLGHIQRGGPPSAYDRFLGLRYGAKAAELIHTEKFGRMASLQGTKIADVPIEKAVAKRKVVSKELWLLAKSFFG